MESSTRIVIDEKLQQRGFLPVLLYPCRVISQPLP